MIAHAAHSKWLRWLPACAMAIASSSCTLLPEKEAITLYTLPAAPIPSQTQSPSTASLVVATPEADRLLDSERIVVAPEPNVINIYGGARWHATAPIMVRERLIKALQQSELFTTVNSDRLPGDLALISELRRFQSEYTQDVTQAVIELDTQLRDPRSNRRLASRQFSATAIAENEEIPSVVAAFGEAGDQLSLAVVEWLAEERDKLVSE
ncbi:ABC-type transport auxiliary lipoprotein family protein [Halomonas sp. Bachu 37]|uniref:ABC-type transport auxiliary lipoprotein family protein n=1 Tax=Halomonas kashgarensis TaxID=3084920 RepID=UPI00321789AF